MHIVDRRRNPGGKSLANRQRFLRRAKEQIQDAVRDSVTGRGMKDMERGGEVSIPASGVKEPALRRAAAGGNREHVLPGNKDFAEGDRIPRPRGGGGGGSGQEGSDSGSGEDEFRFALTQEEFLDLFLEDLELPDLAKKRMVVGETAGFRRAGFSSTGSPANLALGRTMRNALSRRIALKRPKPEALEALEDQARAAEEAGAVERAETLRSEIARLKHRVLRIPYIDPLDVRYRQFAPAPRPIAQAVMFCLMDVSGSMTEGMKDLAKRFYLLLYVFLKRRYKHVEVVFIRHTHEAKEVDEETFFRSPETGGTVVSTALEEMRRVLAARFSPDDWNIYAAQASDGDNTASDNDKTAGLLATEILPACQYYAYLEVGREGDHGPIGFIPRETDLWRLYTALRADGLPIAMRKVRHRKDIYPVFRELFRKGGATAEASP